MSYPPFWVTSNGGRIGQWSWTNSDTRWPAGRPRVIWCGNQFSLEHGFWGSVWRVAQARTYDPACGVGGLLLQNPPWAGGAG